MDAVAKACEEVTLVCYALDKLNDTDAVHAMSEHDQSIMYGAVRMLANVARECDRAIDGA